jgi:hypothetical protein
MTAWPEASVNLTSRAYMDITPLAQPDMPTLPRAVRRQTGHPSSAATPQEPTDECGLAVMLIVVDQSQVSQVPALRFAPPVRLDPSCVRPQDAFVAHT